MRLFFILLEFLWLISFKYHVRLARIQHHRLSCEVLSRPCILCYLQLVSASSEILVYSARVNITYRYTAHALHPEKGQDGDHTANSEQSRAEW